MVCLLKIDWKLIKPKKSLGQNFLVDKNISKKIVNLTSIKNKNIIEIGPGKTLTGIIKRISNNFNHFNINSVSDIDVLKNAI